MRHQLRSENLALVLLTLCQLSQQRRRRSSHLVGAGPLAGGGALPCFDRVDQQRHQACAWTGYVRAVRSAVPMGQWCPWDTRSTRMTDCMYAHDTWVMCRTASQRALHRRPHACHTTTPLPSATRITPYVFHRPAPAPSTTSRPALPAPAQPQPCTLGRLLCIPRPAPASHPRPPPPARRPRCHHRGSAAQAGTRAARAARA